MNTRFSIVAESKRIPDVPEGETAVLLESQDHPLKNSDSQQSQPLDYVTAPSPAPFSLTRTASTFFASSSSRPSLKKRKTFHTDSSDDEKDEKNEVRTVTPPPIDNQPSVTLPLLDLVESRLANINLKELDIQKHKHIEKHLAMKFLFALAEAYRHKNVTDAAYARPELKPIRKSKIPKTAAKEKLLKEMRAKKIEKSHLSDKKHLDNLIYDAIISSTFLGSRSAAISLNKYIEKKNKEYQAYKIARERTGRSFRPQRALLPHNSLFDNNPDSYFPGVMSIMNQAIENIDLHFPRAKAFSIVQNLLPLVNQFFDEYEKTLESSNSLRLRP